MMPDPIRLHRQANTRPGPFAQWLDPASYPAIVDDRPDAYEYLRARAVPERPVVTLAAKLVVWAIAAACGVYCIAIWVGIAS